MAPRVCAALHFVEPFPHAMPPPVTVPGPVTDTVSITLPALPPVNVAVTLRALVIDTAQVGLVPLHAPPQLTNVAPVPGVAVRVTLAPEARLAEHTVPPLPQFRPPPVTVPVPATETLSGKVAAGVPAPPKTAVTLLSPVIVTVQVFLPVQASRHSVNEPPAGGVAVSVTVSSAVTSAVQPEPPLEVQVIPPPVTVPLPITVTVSFGFLKLAVAERSAFIVSVQLLPVPLHEPPQPPKTYPVSGVSTIVSVESWGTSVSQPVSPVSQSMSSPETLPPPAESPETLTLSVLVPTAGV